MIQDMTVGSPIKLIFKFALPLLIGNIFQQLYQLSDIVIVGRLIGVDALAAVGSSASFYFTILMITWGFTSGLTVITAQRFGAKDYIGLRRSVTHSIVAASTLSIVLTAFLLIFLRPLLELMKIPQEIMTDSYNFMIILCAGLFLVVSYNLLSGFIRALGDSRTPLYFLVLSSVLNIILNLLFIAKFKMGVVGSALGTVIAIAISAILCLIFILKRYPLLRLRREDWKLDAELMRNHLQIAIPLAFQFWIISLGLMAMQIICNSFGSNTIAAYTTSFRIEQFAAQPMIALGATMATYAAQNSGAGKINRIRNGVRTCSLLSLIFAVFIALSVRLFGTDLIQVFINTTNPEIIETARAYINITTMFYIFLGQIFIYRNTLQGMGNSIIPLIASIAELIMRIFASLVLVQYFGYIGLCYASPIAWVGAAVVVFVGYIVTLYKLRVGTSKLPQLWHNIRMSKITNDCLPDGAPAE